MNYLVCPENCKVLDNQNVCVVCGKWGIPERQPINNNLVHCKSKKVTIFSILKKNLGNSSNIPPIDEKKLSEIASTYSRLSEREILKSINRKVYLFLALRINLEISDKEALELTRSFVSGP